MRITASFVLIVVIAGCLGSSPENPTPTPSPASPGYGPVTPPVPSFDFSTLIDPDHAAHSLPGLHLSGAGLTEVGYASVQDLMPIGTTGSITQIDVHDGYALVAGNRHGPAFAIVDIRDPQNPMTVGFAPTQAEGWTARFSKDGQYVFYGCQPGLRPGVNCDDPTLPAPVTERGVSVWDVHDKSAPKFVDFLPGSGNHNLQTQIINGVDYVFTETVDIIRFDRETKKLEAVAKVPGTHDATVAQHPITGDWLLYTGTGELAIYNVNDPADPQVVLEPGTWTEGIGWHEQVPFPVALEGRALLALAGETGSSTPSELLEPVSIVDITDPEKPITLAQWAPPFQPTAAWTQYTFSVHEMAANDRGQLAISWFHAGVWVLDLSTRERQEDPALIAAFEPNRPLDTVFVPAADENQPLVPYVWGTAWDRRGYLIIPDTYTGVYVTEPEWGLFPTIDGGA